jgi:hypothetical protein
MFIVETKTGDKIELNNELLIEKLLEAAMKDKDNKNLKDLESFIILINKSLNSNFLLATNKQIYEVYFLAGYYYQIFLQKNNVKEKEENV